MSRIIVEGVKHTYRPPRGRAVLALDDISLDVGEREFVALLGPSGCGKSTLLYLIGGFLPVEGGRILIDGAPVGQGDTLGADVSHFHHHVVRSRPLNVGSPLLDVGRAQIRIHRVQADRGLVIGVRR